MAETNIKEKCGYNGEPGVNPDFQTINCLLTEKALEYKVPPEIVKAIAANESGWKHFDNDGNAIVTDDNGIGIMQITNQPGYDSERLKNDIVYNIDAGVQILNEMFKRTDLPSINNKDREILEHWYFAIMAYNGTKPVNSPIDRATSERNVQAYQEKIYKTIGDYSKVQTTTLPFKKEDFQYDPTKTANIQFVKMNYQFDVPFTKTKHAFYTGQKAITTTSGVSLRPRPTTGNEKIGILNAGEIITINGPIQYDENSNDNHFVWYPVKRSNGTTGFVASSYLKHRFHDVPAGHYAEEEIDYLVDRGILNGVGGDNFGMEQSLTRWQAVLLLNRANHVSLEGRSDPGFIDVTKDHDYYNEIAAAVEEGLFQGISNTQFDPEGTLTRSQMATVLQRLFDFPQASTQHPFTDIPSSEWYADPVARLYASGITDGVSSTEFGPLNKVTREQFAVFLVRSMDENYRIVK